LATHRKIVPLLALLGALALGALACGPAEYGVSVGFGPPEFRTEVAVESPGPGYFWVPGYYDWDGANYVWVQGTWVRPPHEYDVWVAPTYERRGDRFMYHRGHWRNGGRDRHGNDRHDNDRHDHDRGR